MSNLGDRMKEYEAVSNTKLLRRGYTLIRIDGKAFHTYTKKFKKPFDIGMVEDMNITAQYLCRNIQGAKLGYVQSDEISILITDFDNINTSAWFDNKIQKMCSVSASMATAKFNQLRFQRYYSHPTWDNATGANVRDHYLEGYDLDEEMIAVSDIINHTPPIDYLAMFDSRIFQVPTKTEAINALIWRQQDAVKNSISALAQSIFSHKELQGKSGNEMQEMMFQKDETNWNDLDSKLKRGTITIKETYEKDVRTRWVSVGAPTFTKDKEFLNKIIPDNV